MDDRIGKHYRKLGGVEQGQVIRITASISTGHVESVVVKDAHELARAVRSIGVPSRVGETRRIAEGTLRRNWERTVAPSGGR